MDRSRLTQSGLLAFVISSLLLGTATVSSPRDSYGDFTGVAFHSCYDGDTCTFSIPGVHPLLGERISIRIRGIDAPEIRGKCESEKIRARQARDRARELLRAAKRVDLVDVSRGKYFRIVATVNADDIDVARVLIREGLGRPYEGASRAGWCNSLSVP